MIFITGGIASGKRTYAASLGYAREGFAACTPGAPVPKEDAVFDAQNLVDGSENETALQALADQLARKRVVVATEVGAGVVPVDADERRRRECAGRLSCLLAERAGTVVRMCCGIPQTLKG